MVGLWIWVGVVAAGYASAGSCRDEPLTVVWTAPIGLVLHAWIKLHQHKYLQRNIHIKIRNWAKIAGNFGKMNGNILFYSPKRNVATVFD